jgi:hypothetical protein
VKTPPVRVGSDWLALREQADAAARSQVLAEELRTALIATLDGSALRVHDLASGTGSMARWLAPLLHGRQLWLLHDLDDDLLAVAGSHPPGTSSDGELVTFESRRTDVMGLRAEDLGGADLVTASALLDMLIERELDDLVTACVAARCPVLICLSVIGEVTLLPSDRLDRRIAEAFNAHQRRSVERGTLIGPDAVGFVAEAFKSHGFEVRLEPAPWRLGAADAQLTAEWFEGWLGAALDQEPELANEAHRYGAERRAQARRGSLTVTVGHVDLLALPPVSHVQSATTTRSAGAPRRRSDVPPRAPRAAQGSTESARR